MNNADRVFFAMAFNTNSQITQIAVGTGFENVEPAAQSSGVGQRVEPVSLFIHESAENLVWASRRGDKDAFNYSIGHSEAIRREVIIKQELRIPGGLAGGQLRTVLH